MPLLKKRLKAENLKTKNKDKTKNKNPSNRFCWGFYIFIKKKLFQNIFLIKKKFSKNKYYFYLKTPKITLIIPKLGDKYLVVSQYRIPIRKRIYEFPGGIVDQGDTPEKSSLKELLEETGYKSLKKPTKLLTLYPDAGRLDCEYICYFTDNITKIDTPEKGILIHFFNKRKIIKLIKNKKFSHSCHVAAFYTFLNEHN